MSTPTNVPSRRHTVGVRIVGLGHAVPDRIVSNAELEEDLGLQPGWIEDRTGIVERRWIKDGDLLSDLATEAGAIALDAATEADIPSDQFGMVFLATSTPDHLLPPSAPRVAHNLALTSSGGIDMAGACPGFLYALMAADGYVRAHGKPALVIAANVLSRRINRAERASAILFADAAGAVALAPSETAGQGLLGAEFKTDASAYDLIKITSGGSAAPFTDTTSIGDTQMTLTDGARVFTRAVELMATTATEACRSAGLSTTNAKHVIPHQANGRIVAAVTKTLGVDRARVWTSFAKFGNSSAATIPLTLSLGAKSRSLDDGDVILMTAAGAGLNAGSLVWRM